VSAVYCDKNLEQRIHVKFCVQFGNSDSEALAILALACGEYAMMKSSVSEWHRRIKEGRGDVQDGPRSGQPKPQRSDVNADGVRTLVRSG
jgi:hypothetical protein